MCSLHILGNSVANTRPRESATTPSRPVANSLSSPLLLNVRSAIGNRSAVDCNRCGRRPAPVKTIIPVGSEQQADSHRSRVRSPMCHARGHALWQCAVGLGRGHACAAWSHELLSYQLRLSFRGQQWPSRVTENQGSILEREPERRLPLPRWAAGTQIAQWKRSPVRQRRTAAIPFAPVVSGTWNGWYPNTPMSIYRRESLVPAAAVIPAPKACTEIAAVKTPVVDCRMQVRRRPAHDAKGALRSTVCPHYHTVCPLLAPAAAHVRISTAGGELLPASVVALCAGGAKRSCSRPPSVGAAAISHPTHVCST